ncbi:MAG: SGNH/GDSL hydrolase family protein [bacterium]
MENKKIMLFQGDSITDCDRNRADINSLGDGYVSLLNDKLKDEFRVINKGIAGDTTQKIKNRWVEDCLDLNPSFLSLYAGVNDTWFRYRFNKETSIEVFEKNFRYMIDSFKEKYPEVSILLVSPFIIPLEDVLEGWFEDLKPKIDMVEALSKEYKTLYVPLQKIFDEKLKENSNAGYWVLDGVHPTKEGHKVIAEACFEEIKKELNK